MRRLLPPILIAAAIGCVCALNLAGAAPTTLATLSAETRVSAAGGWVAWSVKQPDGWHLTTLHDGRVETSAVAPAPYPLDLDLGTDAGGRPVATFSRCEYTNVRDASVASNCRVRVVDLQDGVEGDAGVPMAEGASDTRPSMWRGRIAFARYVAGHNPDVEQVYLFTPGQASPRKLGFGSVGRCRKHNSCTGDEAVAGAVEALDLGEHLVAYLWNVSGGDSSHGATELRAVRLSDRKSVNGGWGYNAEVCTEDDPDTIELSSPVVTGGRVLYIESNYTCYEGGSFIHRLDPARRRRMSARFSGSLMQVAGDGSTLYGLVAKTPRTQEYPACSPAAPCKLQRLTMPTFRSKFGRGQRRPAS